MPPRATRIVPIDRARERVLDLDLVRLKLRADAADRDVAAAVDDEPGEASEPVGDGVSAQSLARPAGVEHHAGWAPDDPGRVVDLDLTPARVRIRSGGRPRWCAGERLGERGRLGSVERGAVAGALERPHERRVKQLRRCAPPPTGRPPPPRAAAATPAPRSADRG